MIQARSLGLSFGDRAIFKDISFLLQENDRVGLVGRNGSGKTTLLKALGDASILDEGTIAIQKNKKIAYMPQEVVLQSSLSILEEAMTAFTALSAVQQKLRIIEKELETNYEDQLVERYSALLEELLELDEDSLAAKAKKILTGLGFSQEQFDQPVSTLSVGWKMRIVLAKLLLQEADFYLFDEPTNHLDLHAKEWFLSFLKQARFGFMLICHERYFLDELCQKILDLERGKATWYTGNYTKYLIEKEHNAALLEGAYVQQQKEIRQKQAIIDKFRAGQRSTLAKSMEKRLEKVERIEMPPSPKSVHFTFPPIQPSGKDVLNVKNVAHSFGDKKLFERVHLEIKKGQKIALIAPNGVGKTTLFNLIAQVLPFQQGSIAWGHNVNYALFNQDQNKALNLKASIMDNIKERCPRVNDQTIRSFLGAFLFSSDDVFKPVEVLSGGEKNRVGMVAVMLQQANLLLLDEPTNHLDIPSKEVLVEGLRAFPGTILFVSHDRDFINELATDIIELTPKGVYAFHGNYDEYVYFKNKINQK